MVGRKRLVFMTFLVGVVDLEDKCVPAHLVSPNFSSSSLDSWKRAS